jgi:GTP-binding GTPase Middle Region
MEIFHRHAHSREAKLQVEIARLKYVSPRLRESLAGGGRQQGSGAGESDLDLDRRKIRDGLAELKEHVEDIQRDNDSDTVGFIKKLPHDLVRRSDPRLPRRSKRRCCCSSSTRPIVAIEHKLDPPLVTLMVGIGIPLSFLTLPLWWYVLQGI